ncbi:ribonuclease HII [Tianweitania sediminis]|uniref:Ribonuclease HII n=1 Tax=Tianweitania sediminis TaxID=1502156 RepID=A0A8J7R6F1_9HYPH|nr:ribonuclease HII [Tianweitania sediminis]MBP0438747.1 ribonuclease HII [Tianweitania sediminis]
MAPRNPDSPPLFEIVSTPDFAREKRAIKADQWPVAGADEAGRGPLAGPVVAAAVILDPKRIPKGLDDSKRLTSDQREALFIKILKTSLAVGVTSICAESVDEINILQASLTAMKRAVDGLVLQPKLVLVDGRDVPAGLPCSCEALIKGDQRSQSIAAASIVAKVMRDRMMTRCSAQHDRYGFDSHMGYATVRHRDAIGAHGPVARLHRMSFAPLKPDAGHRVQGDLVDAIAMEGDAPVRLIG